MPLQIGGPKARKLIRRGEFGCAFHYIGDEQEIAACFFPLTRKGKDGQTPTYIVPLASAHKYTDDRYLFDAACKAAQIMGHDAYSRSTVFGLMTFFQDMLIELCTMPPSPKDEAEEAVRQAIEVNASGTKIDMVLH